MQNVVQVLEKQYLEEKRTALEEQRVMYERELESLRQQLSPEKTPPPHHNSSDRLTLPAAHAVHSKLRLWTEERLVQKFHLLNHGFVRDITRDSIRMCHQCLFRFLRHGVSKGADSPSRFCCRCGYSDGIEYNAIFLS